MGIIITVLGVDNGLYAQDHDELPMYSIYFSGGSYYIREEHREGLFEFISSYENIQNYSITVHSFTDNIGGAAFNEWLSKMRSEATIELLNDFSIQREAISIKDFGQFNPIYDNSTWEGKLMNRRVDVILWPIVL
ncbi:MAG: OmpA family protein [Cyclobacteriaceae bacterium]